MTEEIKQVSAEPTPVASVKPATIQEVKKPVTLEQKFNALCKLLQLGFKEDSGRVIAVK